jgi:hypothetical protein
MEQREAVSSMILSHLEVRLRSILLRASLKLRYQKGGWIRAHSIIHLVLVLVLVLCFRNDIYSVHETGSVYKHSHKTVVMHLNANPPMSVP